MLGYLRNELLGYPLSKFIDEKCLPTLEGELEKRKSGVRSTYELKWRRKDGTALYTIISAAPLFDGGGRYVGGFGIMTDITPRRLAEKKLENYQSKLRSLASELSLAEERERRRIAAELHDRIGQSLAITKIKLGVLGEKVQSSDLLQDITEIRTLIDQTIKDTRSLTLEISPPILYELGFEAAVEWLSEHVQQQHGLSVGFSCDGKVEPLGNDVRVLLFKVVQELLINVVKHAKAKAAAVSLCGEEDRLRILVEDDGRGFEVESIRSSMGYMAGFGLFNICERINDLGGRVDVRSVPGRGTRITVSSPRKSTFPRSFERKSREEDPFSG
jgi:PAS domain S-box-containing protein